MRKCICCAQVKSLSNLGWFLSIGTFGQLFAALVVLYKLVVNPWQGAITELVHNGELPVSSCKISCRSAVSVLFGTCCWVSYVCILACPDWLSFGRRERSFKSG